MRIAMVSEHASPLTVLGGADAGGQNVYVAALAQRLGRRGHEVVVHTRRQDPDVPRQVPFCDDVVVDHVSAGPPRPIPKDDIWPYIDDLADDLAQRWRARRPDVVHAHFWMSGIAAMRAAEDLGIPTIQTFHALGVVKQRYQGSADTSPPARLPAERSLIAGMDHIIATCSDEAFELRHLGADMGRVSIVPCGVNLELFTPAGPRLARDGGWTHRIASINRLVPRKGVDDVIRALADVPDTELLIAGGPAIDQLDDDDEVRRLRDVAATHGVTDRVRFLGALERDAVPQLLRSSDLLVATPWYEPFGIVPLEAMATGTPVVAAAVGGMIDTVTDDVTGVHVPPRDPMALGDALRRLLGDRQRLERLAAAGPPRVRQRYSWDRVADDIVTVYERTVRRVRRDGTAAAASYAGVSPAHLDGDEAPGRSGDTEPLPSATEHVHALVDALGRLRPDLGQIERWGRDLADRLRRGHRLLTCGNGGSAADAQHLAAELVGRFRDERAPFSALALHADTSSLTAIANDYGYDEVFARQVLAHGRPRDVLLAFSTSGSSANVLAAARAAHQRGMTVWACTGGAPNPLADLADEAVAVDAVSTATVQEVHGVLLHALCAAFDHALLEHEDRSDIALLGGRRAAANGATVSGLAHGSGGA